MQLNWPVAPQRNGESDEAALEQHVANVLVKSQDRDGVWVAVVGHGNLT